MTHLKQTRVLMTLHKTHLDIALLTLLLAIVLVGIGLSVSHRPGVAEAVAPVSSGQKPLTSDPAIKNSDDVLPAAMESEMMAVAVPQRLDLGAGYILELSQGTGKIINPVQAKVVDASVKELYLGAGAWLEPITGGAKVFTVAGGAKPTPVVQRLDLGAGYTLMVEGHYSHIVESAKAAMPIRVAAIAPTRIDIGSGYILVQQDQNWTMVH